MDKQPKTKQEWEDYLEANREQIERAARQVAALHKQGDTESLIKIANRDAEAYAKQAIQERDEAHRKDKRVD